MRVRRIVTTYVALLLVVSGVSHSEGETVTLDFDPPSFQNGQILGWVGDIGFFGNATVFQPAGVPTQTPPYALGKPNWCESPACTNAAFVLGAIFRRRASEVTVRVGSEPVPASAFFCFPEGTDCPVYARLVGMSGNSVVVDTRDVELFSAVSSRGVLAAPITRELKVADKYGRIDGFQLYVGKGMYQPEHNYGNPGRVQIDSLIVRFNDTAPPTPPDPPAAPTVQILQPSGRIDFPYSFRIEGRWSAPAGIYAICVRVNEAIPIQNVFCENDVMVNESAFTFAADVRPALLQPAGNVVNVGIIDLLGRKVTASLPLLVGAPPPPDVSIWSPPPGVWTPGGASSALSLSGRAWVPGGVTGFCVKVFRPAAPQTPPGVADCNELKWLVPSSSTGLPGTFGHFTGVPLDSSKLQPGPNDVTVYAFDAWKQVGHATVRGTLPANLRISGVEVTQGSQTFAIRDTSGPYSGAELVKRVPTIVRVFASASSGGPFPGVKANLRGFVSDPRLGERPLGMILPDNGAQTVTAGPSVVPLETRGKPDTAFIFTLPTNWTHESGLRLRATVNDPKFYGTVPECATCDQDNVVDVTNINFKNPLPIQTISPVAIRWLDAHGSYKDPPPVEEVFRDFRALVPLPSWALQVRPYVAVINGSNQLGLPQGIDIVGKGINAKGECDSACRSHIFGLVAEFEISNQPGFTIGITTAQIRGWTAPVTYVRFPTFLTWELIALASTTGTAPLKLGVAHELMHQFGFLHASGACGDAGQQLSKPWPPDGEGRLQGIGLDRRIGSGPKPGTYAVFADGAAGGILGAKAHDIMSYCAGSQSWLSAQYWNDFGKTLTFWELCVQGNCPGQMSAPADAIPTYRVIAVRDSTKEWKIVRITRSRIPKALRQMGTSASPGIGSVQLVGRDPNGGVVARASAQLVAVADQPGTQLASGELPAASSLQSISVVVDGKQVASRAARRFMPRISLLTPTTLEALGEAPTVSVRWSVPGADSELTVRVEYSDDDGATYRPIGVTSSRDGMELPARLFSASKAARIRLTANDGFEEASVTSVAFPSRGSPPTVSLLEPHDDVSVLSTATVNVAGMAFDDRGLPIEAAHLTWTIDGQPFGTGRDAVLPRMEPGRHVVELTARDRLHRFGSAKRTITVGDGGIEAFDDSEYRGGLAVRLVLLVLIVLAGGAIWFGWTRRSRASRRARRRTPAA